MRADEVNHAAARATLEPRLGVDDLMTHSYVIVESVAVIHRRLGARAVSIFLDRLVSVLDVSMVDEDLQRTAVASFVASGPSRVSLVDRTSFEFMRRRRIDTAITFDRDFAAEGFTVVP